jgi:hypothetical protein
MRAGQVFIEPAPAGSEHSRERRGYDLSPAVRREMHGSLPKLLFISGLGGISNASILAAINAGIQNSSSGQKPGLWRPYSFGLGIVLMQHRPTSEKVASPV